MEEPSMLATLMANNDAARAHALRLNDEARRLRSREARLVHEIRSLLARPSVAEDDKRKFLEWLLFFQTDEREELGREERPSDARKAEWKSAEGDEGLLERCVERARDLALLTRLKRKVPPLWLANARRTASAGETMDWERDRGFRLPAHFRALLLRVGGLPAVVDEGFASEVHWVAYSPLLALLPLDRIGFTEVWFREDDPVDLADDERTASVLRDFGAGHEFDDAFVCSQLCGSDPEDGQTVRVLLVGAPLQVKTGKHRGGVHSRMFLNVRPQPDGSFCGDGLLYRLDGWGEESELTKIGTSLDWIESCFLQEARDRLELGDPGKLIETRFPHVFEREKDSSVPRKKSRA